MERHALYSLPFLLLLACTTKKRPDHETLRTGPWHLALDLGEAALPITFDLERTADDGLRMHIRNGKEVILVNDITRRGDSLFIRMPVFDSEFVGHITGDGLMTGRWSDRTRGAGHRIPFTAKAGRYPRFPAGPPSRSVAQGTWEVHFSPGGPGHYPAVGIFEQDVDNRVTGTFLTETGDYRFLEGHVSGDSLMLSCFDGSHAYLFEAAIQGDSMQGLFRSGDHWTEPWVAVRNADFTLRDPDSLTSLREDRAMVSFEFPDLDGRPVSSADERFKGRVLLIQVMGSWCPNCMDETRLLTALHSEYHEQGLDVIAVAFERHEDPARARQGLQRFRNELGISYTILHGGRANKADAAKALPFLDRVVSYPTLIVVDRTGQVRRIHTGMQGPGTGRHYEDYERSLRSLVKDLLEEAHQAGS